MMSRLHAVCFRADRPEELARFWSGVLGWEVAGEPDGAALLPPDASGFRVRFVPGGRPKTVRNRGHFDLTSACAEDQRRTVARVLELGGRHIDVGQTPEDAHVVLADPEGNELCVIEPDNAFLAGTGAIGALACDGTQEVGHFWSRALGWPLVWDQDEETAVQSPDGGTKITWGGPPVAPQTGTDRLFLELAVSGDGPRTGDGGLEAEVDRLLALGATRAADGDGEEDGRGVRLRDPDGNAFALRGSR
ncbi:VOC family protein [uncultured Streptomyces sp.]|uniref:VOC family protein n=1 Tax=uncultured Streptomyces sp. TaxID=174707 RepID=UPI00261AF606|nr:VOC family protein [uncultured Streptomyces sp.]